MPMADLFVRWHIPNAISSLMALSIFVALLVVAILVILQPTIDLVSRFPDITRAISSKIDEMKEVSQSVSSMSKEMTEALGRGTGREVVIAEPSLIEDAAFATPLVIAGLLITLLMSYFMIEARVRLRRNLLLDRQSVDSSLKAARTMRSITDRLSHYIGTVSSINLGVGVFVGVGTWLLGLESPIMWGGLATILNFVPYVGPVIMICLLTLAGFAQWGSEAFIFVPPVFYIIVHAVEANIVTPSILGQRFALNPVIILIAISYFGWTWGFVGTLLSVPLLIVAKALVDQLGHPNIIGFMLGEPLFESEGDGDSDDKETEKATTEVIA